MTTYTTRQLECPNWSSTQTFVAHMGTTQRLVSETEALMLAVLGPPLVRFGGHAVSFRTRKELALLVYLALTRTPQPREHLASLFWPDHDRVAARNVVRTTLSRLRQHLTAAGSVPIGKGILLLSERDALGREVVGLARAAPPVRLDIEVLEAVMSPAEETAVAADGEAEARLQRAAEAYRGAFLEGVRFDDAPELEEWVGAQRAHWEGQFERVLDRLTTLQLERRAFTEASTTARRRLGLNALCEQAYRALMRALAGAGDWAGALAVYEECRRILQTQLAVEPSPETVALAERLRRLPGSSLRGAGPRPAKGGRLARRSSSGAGASGSLDRATPGMPHLELPFVGRERGFAALVEAYRAARAGQVRVVVLVGEAGVGKTRLAEEFLRWTALEGADVLRGRGYEMGDRLPFQPLVDALRPRLAREHAPEDLVADVWLSELVRLLPELRERYPDLPSPAALAGGEVTAQGRLYEAVVQLLLALADRAKPGALVLFYDDLQWIDPATRDLLLYRLQRQQEAGSPHLLVLAVRTEDVASMPELERWLVQVARQVPTTRLALGALAQAETAQALASVLAEPYEAGGGSAPQLGPWLYAHTKGQPFYLVETLRALVDQGILVPQRGAAGADRRSLLALAPGVRRWPHMVPGTVGGLIRGQLGCLSLPAHELLAAMAVLGPAATFERLCRAAATGRRRGAGALDELRRRRLVVEDGCEPPLEGDEPVVPELARVRFAHDQVRAVVYTEAGQARRRLFHRRAAAVLEDTAPSPRRPVHHTMVAEVREPAFR